MNRYFPNLGIVIASLASLLAYRTSHGGPIPLQLNQTYSQNFDALARTPENMDFAWMNDQTINGWFSNRQTYRVNQGTAITGSLYSFGPVNNMDRALGSIVTDGAGVIFYGADFQNKTGAIITDLRVEYVGEQWRDSSRNAQKLEFAITTNPFLPGGTRIAQLDFTSPTNTGAMGAINGNAAANRSAITFTIKQLNFEPDALFDIRWTDSNDAGQDHGLSIDDFSITVTATKPIPEPSTVAVVGLLSVVGLRREWKRRGSRGCSSAGANCSYCALAG